MRQEPKLFSSERPAEPPQDGFRVEPREAPPGRRRDDDEDTGGRGFPWRWLVAVVVLAALGFGGWKAVGLFGAQMGGGDVPLFTASVDPFKHRPDDPGGTEVPNQDSQIYNVLPGEESAEGLEVLLPEPEEPVVREDTDPEAGDGVIDVGSAPVADIQAPEEGAEPIFTADQVSELVDQAMTGSSTVPIPTDKPTPPAAPATTIVEVAPEAGETGSTVATTESGGGLSFSDVAAALGEDDATGTAATTGSAAATTTDTAAATTEPAAETTAPASGDGVARVQIAAYLTRESADEAWQRLARDNIDLLGTLDARVMETTIAGTTFHRLQVGAFANPADAKHLCDALLQRHIDCMVVGP